MDPIILIGAGAIGSHLAVALAKAGHSLTIMDADYVVRKNIQNQAFLPEHIDKPKVQALASMYPDNIHPILGWYEGQFDADFLIGCADQMQVRRLMCDHCSHLFDTRLVESIYTIYFGKAEDLRITMNYDNDDPELIGKTPPCEQPSCRADLVLVATGHLFRNIQHWLDHGRPAFTYCIGNLDTGFHHEECDWDG